MYPNHAGSPSQVPSGGSPPSSLPTGALGGPAPSASSPPEPDHGKRRRRSAQPLKPGVPCRNIYICDLPENASEELLLSLCSGCGPISSAQVIVAPESRECKGYGFVLFENQESATSALTAIATKGKYRVAYGKLSPEKRAPLHAAIPKDATNIYFCDLPVSITTADLHELLEGYGRILSSRIITDSSSGAGRGVAFARMESEAVCQAVIQALNGKPFPGSASGANITCRLADDNLALQRMQSQQQLSQSSPMPQEIAPPMPFFPPPHQPFYYPTPAFGQMRGMPIRYAPYAAGPVDPRTGMAYAPPYHHADAVMQYYGRPPPMPAPSYFFPRPMAYHAMPPAPMIVRCAECLSVAWASASE